MRSPASEKLEIIEHCVSSHWRNCSVIAFSTHWRHSTGRCKSHRLCNKQVLHRAETRAFLRIEHLPTIQAKVCSADVKQPQQRSLCGLQQPPNPLQQQFARPATHHVRSDKRAFRPKLDRQKPQVRPDRMVHSAS